MTEDSNIEEINKQIEEQLRMNQKLQQQINMLETAAKKYMSKEAISRYGNLKMAHPELAIRAIAIIAQAAEAGQLRESINDETFKLILKQIQEKNTA